MGPDIGIGKVEKMKQYFALDMPNGKTYIGRQDGDALNRTLEDVVVTNTNINLEDASDRNADDVKWIYRNIYRKCFENLSPAALTHIVLGNGWGYSVCTWNLGCDILNRSD
jgi:hypothetical protein